MRKMRPPNSTALAWLSFTTILFSILQAALRPSLQDACRLAVAFDGNWVQGAVGALLVAGCGYKFVVGEVDGVNLMANQPYMVGENGEFVAANRKP